MDVIIVIIEKEFKCVEKQVVKVVCKSLFIEGQKKFVFVGVYVCFVLCVVVVVVGILMFVVGY